MDHRDSFGPGVGDSGWLLLSGWVVAGSDTIVLDAADNSLVPL